MRGLLSVALPVAGFMMGGPAGAAAGGALAGAYQNKKNPLMGAAIGGGLSYFGGSMMPGASGLSSGTTSALGSAGVNAGSQQAGMLAAQEAGIGAGGGLLGGLKTASGYAQPALQAMQAANMANGLLGGNEQPQQVAPMQAQGAPALQGIVQGNEQMAAQNMQEMMKRRMSNQQLIQQMMGRQYG